MKRVPVENLILDELKSLRTDVQTVQSDLSKVRSKDIPDLRTDVAGFHGKIKDLEKQQTWSTRLYTVLGGVIAVFVAKFTGSHS